MSDLQHYVHERKAASADFAADYNAGYARFKAEVITSEAMRTESAERSRVKPIETGLEYGRNQVVCACWASSGLFYAF